MAFSNRNMLDKGLYSTTYDYSSIVRLGLTRHIKSSGQVGSRPVATGLYAIFRPETPTHPRHERFCRASRQAGWLVGWLAGWVGGDAGEGGT